MKALEGEVRVPLGKDLEDDSAVPVSLSKDLEDDSAVPVSLGKDLEDSDGGEGWEQDERGQEGSRADNLGEGHVKRGSEAEAGTTGDTGGW